MKVSFFRVLCSLFNANIFFLFIAFLLCFSPILLIQIKLCYYGFAHKLFVFVCFTVVAFVLGDFQGHRQFGQSSQFSFKCQRLCARFRMLALYFETKKNYYCILLRLWKILFRILELPFKEWNKFRLNYNDVMTLRIVFLFVFFATLENGYRAFEVP